MKKLHELVPAWLMYMYPVPRVSFVVFQDIVFKHKDKGKDNQSYRTSILPEKQWKIQQVARLTFLSVSSFCPSPATSPPPHSHSPPPPPPPPPHLLPCSLSLSLSFCLLRTLSLCLCVSLCLFVSVSLSFSLSLTLPLSHCLPHLFFLSLSLSLLLHSSLCGSLSISKHIKRMPKQKTAQRKADNNPATSFAPFNCCWKSAYPQNLHVVFCHNKPLTFNLSHVWFRI